MTIMFIIVVILSTSRCISSAQFPLMEYLGIKNMTSSEEIKLKLYYLCASGMSWKKTCRCDDKCMEYQECCIDFLWNTNSSETLDKYVERFISESNHERYKLVQCKPIISGLTGRHVAENVLMVSECRKTSSKQITDKCLNTRSTIPVLGNDGYIYKNKYCASCQGVSEFDMTNVTAECNNKRNISSSDIFKQYEDCTFKFVTNTKQSEYVRQCTSSVINKCELNDRKNCQLCRSYTGGIFYNDKCYKNIHCVKEHEKHSKYDTGNRLIECLDAKSYKTGFAFGIFLPKYSFLVSFTSGDELKEQNEKSKCPADETYDSISEQCVKELLCAPGHVLIGTVCTKVEEDSDELNDVIHHGIHGENITKLQMIKACMNSNIYILLKSAENSKNDLLNFTNHIKKYSTHVYKNSSVIIFKIKQMNINNIIREGQNVKYQLVVTSVPVVYANDLYGFDFSRSFKNSKICAFPIIHQYDSFNISSNCFVFLDNSTLYGTEYILMSKVDIDVNKVKKKKVFKLVTCKQFHLESKCALRRIKEYTILSNKTIIDNNKKMYFVDQYTPLQSGIGVCILAESVNRLSGWLRVVNAVEGYITIVGCSFSIVGYLVVIITYSVIRELKTVPGKNIVGLCIMLMLSDMLMLSSMSQQQTWCELSAILLHFIALSAQFWAAVVAFDIWSTFHGKSLKRNMRSQKRFICYCLFALICPLCIVVLSITLDKTVQAVNIGYGKFGVCWITNFNARLVTYIIPVVLFTVFTTTLLTYTVFQIFKQSRRSQKLLKKSGGDNLSLARMALKLVLLLGVIEICGLFQVTSSSRGSQIFNSIFRLLYSIARSFRGVFVCLLYVVTDRVFTVYRNVRERRSYNSSTRFTSVSHTNNSIRKVRDNEKLMDASSSM